MLLRDAVKNQAKIKQETLEKWKYNEADPVMRNILQNKEAIDNKFQFKAKGYIVKNENTIISEIHQAAQQKIPQTIEERQE